jgi:uncharacterized protein YecE (DUF72 family)
VRCGRFYPASARGPEARLRYYASHLSMVEVDATHYMPLARRNAELWAERTSSGFAFHVKAHALVTGHPSRPQALPLDLQAALPEPLRAGPVLMPGEVPGPIIDELAARFVDALTPLRDAGKLAAVLLQFPPWLAAGRESARVIQRAAQRMGGLPVAVELRHPSWLSGGFQLRTEQFLRRHGVALVCTDGPPELAVPLPVASMQPLVTSPRLAVIRLHGRRPKYASGPTRRGYSPEELAAWGDRALAMAREAEQVHVVFANCWEDLAVRDAMALSLALSLPPPSRPLPAQAELPIS